MTLAVDNNNLDQSSLQALHSMLEQELWQRLPMLPGNLPDLVAALEGQQYHTSNTTSSASAAGGAAIATAADNSFELWVSRGNPWRAQKGEHLLALTVIIH